MLCGGRGRTLVYCGWRGALVPCGRKRGTNALWREKEALEPCGRRGGHWYSMVAEGH